MSLNKKLLFGIVFFLLLLTVVGNASDICKEPIKPNKECLIITPTLSCSNYSYKVLNTSGNIIDSGLLEEYTSDGVYYFNFSEPIGNYVLWLCDGSTREVQVGDQGENKMIAIILMIVLIGGYFLMLGYKNYVWGAKLLGYGFSFIQLLMGFGIMYAYELGKNYTNLLYIDFIMSLILGFGLGIYTFTMTTASAVDPGGKPGEWGVSWKEK